MRTGSGGLTPRHQADLRQSALIDATIRAAGIYSETDPVAVGKLLGWAGPAAALGGAMVIPYRRPDGSLNCYARVKPDRPRVADGKPVKYESPRGRGNH